MRAITTPLIIAFITCVAPISLASEPKAINGELLHNAACLHCHSPGLYQRSNRRLQNAAAVTQQVFQCQRMLELNWRNEEVEAVSAYLIERHYAF